MVLDKIARLLSQTIGLDPDIASPSQIARSAETRRVRCKLPDLESYWARLQTSATELEELIEILIVPETWFFRDGKPFDYLKTYITSEWRPSPNRNILQVLSVPSSTGEEPYSIAIALLEAGLHPKQFQIDAIDISHRSLAKARRGVYTKNSFRGEDWKLRAHYFQQTEQGYELPESIRKLVNFQQGNVLTALALTQKQYNIIFCRNLLIYLKSEVCEQVLAALDRLLIPSGLMFVGASETGKIVADPYKSIRQPFTFAYRKQEGTGGARGAGEVRGTSIGSVAAGGAGGVWEKGRRGEIINTPTPDSRHPTPINSQQSTVNSQPSINLQAVRQMADEGRLAEATTLCQSYLSDHPTSADAYVLLGELYQANQQNRQAEQCFQRAIYLDPNSYPALVHLALLKENQGDPVGANLIQQRISALGSRFQNRRLEGET
ncbi:CheR family methyltransferase [Planktothrix paucivesiculata]|uniref:MCP methyltransferase, CheR-type with Tpr repeats n=1 Tax=Planktothrix paucivesiculata PCC 9631 TaxID=671071 RepID=A0A7Z9DZK5_9CYAN|nr:protein-glutamate O-methyltransferase CheR [Planktothrix paucivesiculata]VXD17815.1 MCP methyltransferase, CheR-type with Tpr repeats [Planktothrix paucivesiculata PCC 9631]